MPYGSEAPFTKNFVHFIMLYKMENMRMPELRALARERELRGYSKLRNYELIAFREDNEHRTWRQQPQQQPAPLGGPGGALAPWGPPPEIPATTEGTLTKRQCKHRRAKDSKLAKRFVDLNAEINALKSQMEELKEKISHASRSAHSGFKRKKIRTMKRDIDKISAQLAESEAHLESMRVPKDPISGTPLKLHPPSRPKHIEAKIAELNKKIHRAKNR